MSNRIKDKIKLGAGISSIFTMLFAFNHCIIQEPVKFNKSNDNSSSNYNVSDNYSSPPQSESTPVDNNQDNIPDDTGGDTSLPTNPIQNKNVNTGIKNYEQIYLTMSNLTGVDPTTNAVRNIYRDLKTQLPSDNNLKSFLAANQVGITKLAAEFCHRLVDSSSLRQMIWPSINFGRTPNQELNNVNKSLIVTQILDRFWGSNVDMSTRGVATLELNSLLNDLLANENLNSSTTTRNVVKGVCIAALSSASVILL